MYRCPGWVGGGGTSAKVDRCPTGALLPWTIYHKRLWWFRFNRCPACRVLVLPYAVRYVDPTNWWSVIRWKWFAR